MKTNFCIGSDPQTDAPVVALAHCFAVVEQWRGALREGLELEKYRELLTDDLDSIHAGLSLFSETLKS